MKENKEELKTLLDAHDKLVECFVRTQREDIHECIVLLELALVLEAYQA